MGNSSDFIVPTISIDSTNESSSNLTGVLVTETLSIMSNQSSVGDDDELYQIPFNLAIALTLAYIVASAASVIGNFMVLWIVGCSKAMHSVTNAFIANLAAADLIIGLFCIPFQFQAALLQKWILPHFMCTMCPTLQVVSLNVSIFTLVALSLDRHRAITRPFSPRKTARGATSELFIVWLFSILLAIPYSMAFRVVTSDTTRPAYCAPINIDRQFFRYYNQLLVVLQYVIPLLVITVAYAHMAWVLCRGDGVITDASRSDGDRASQSKRRVSQSICLLSSHNLLCSLNQISERRK